MPNPLLASLPQAYATGWLVAAPIGPVNLEIIRRSLTRRLACGFMVGLGATCVDAAYLIVFTAGLGTLLTTYPALNRVLFLVGGGCLTLIGLLALREAWAYVRRGMDEAHRIERALDSRWARFTESLPGHYLLGVAMCASNPMTLAFWSSLALNFAHLPMSQRFVASGCVWLGALSWVLTLMAILAFARRWVGPRLFALVTGAGGLCMLYFGARFLVLGVAGAN